MNYKNVHDRLTVAYYQQKSLAYNTFFKLHQALHLYHEQDDMVAGTREDFDVSELQDGSLMRSQQIADLLKSLNVKITTLQSWDT